MYGYFTLYILEQFSVLFLFSLCLQGASSLDNASSPSVASIQQPRGRHSFVHEHFQAQYRWEAQM